MSLYNRFIAFFIIIRIINYKDYIMSDRYGDFVQSSIGKKVAKNFFGQTGNDGAQNL